MQTSFKSRLVTGMLLLVVTAVLGACARNKAPTADQAASAAATAQRKNRSAADDAMVSAVSASGKPGAPVDLKFDLAARPELGKPLEVRISVLPLNASITQLRVVFQPNEAVEVQAGSEMAVQDRPAEGVTISHTVRIVPRRNGVSYLGAVALVEGAGVSIARSFAIPIIVGDPIEAEQALADKPAQGNLAKGARGESIVSLPDSAPR